MPKPTDRVVFHWLNKFAIRESEITTYSNFKAYAIELLEQEQHDIVRDVWYTFGKLTKRLDYYNEKL